MARLVPATNGQRERINSAGLIYHYGSVQSSTSRELRQMLENADPSALHLCRGEKCAQAEAQGHGDGRFHVREYSVLTSDAVVDLGKHSNMSTYRIFVLIFRLWRGAVFALCWTVCTFWRTATCCCRGPKTPKEKKKESQP